MTSLPTPATSTPASPTPASPPGSVPEVRSYLKKLLLLILAGLLLMSTAAAWAWKTYGQALEEAPPLPTGVPPVSSVPLPETTK